MTSPSDMSWLAYAPLLGGAVVLGFAPLGRARRSVSVLFDAARIPVRPSRDSGEERISSAMRNWTQERADIDLAQEEVAEPQPEPSRPGPPPPQAVPVPTIESPVQAIIPMNSVQEEEIDFVAPATRVFDFQSPATPNYYEALQISPRADHETIHRVYRMMAARFHPDNPISGDYRRFLQLNEAYEVLSNTERRAQYDAALEAYETQPLPIFGARMFVAGLQGETNRRLGVLSLLYQRRRMNQTHPGISVLELENRMALPREHLEFTLWYLRSKKLVHITEERSDYALTVAGVDHIESHSSRNQIVRHLLTTPGEAEKAEPSGRKRVLRGHKESSCGVRKRPFRNSATRVGG